MSILYEILKLVIHGFPINLLSIDNNNKNDSNNKTATTVVQVLESVVVVVNIICNTLNVCITLYQV